MLVEAYDVGGTWLRGALIEGSESDAPVIVSQIKERTKRDPVMQIRDLSWRLRERSAPDAVSIVLPGPVRNGVLLKAPPLGIIHPINVQEQLQQVSGRVYVENDLNAALQAELRMGIGTQRENFYLLTISTGIGAGIVLNGKAVLGNAGEFGHNVIERREDLAFRCGCQNKGCWSALCSGRGIENLAKHQYGRVLECEEVFANDDAGDPFARRIIVAVEDYNAQGIGMMVNALEVEAIAVMGSIGRHRFSKVIPSREHIAAYTVNEVPDILPTTVGDEIGLLGAFYVAFQQHQSSR